MAVAQERDPPGERGGGGGMAVAQERDPPGESGGGGGMAVATWQSCMGCRQNG